MICIDLASIQPFLETPGSYQNGHHQPHCSTSSFGDVENDPSGFDTPMSGAVGIQMPHQNGEPVLPQGAAEEVCHGRWRASGLLSRKLVQLRWKLRWFSCWFAMSGALIYGIGKYICLPNKSSKNWWIPYWMSALWILNVQVLTLHLEVPSTYVNDAEQELQNYVEKFPAQMFKTQPAVGAPIWCLPDVETIRGWINTYSREGMNPVKLHKSQVFSGYQVIHSHSILHPLGTGCHCKRHQPFRYKAGRLMPWACDCCRGLRQATFHQRLEKRWWRCGDDGGVNWENLPLFIQTLLAAPFVSPSSAERQTATASCRNHGRSCAGPGIAITKKMSTRSHSRAARRLHVDKSTLSLWDWAENQGQICKNQGSNLYPYFPWFSMGASCHWDVPKPCASQNWSSLHVNCCRWNSGRGSWRMPELAASRCISTWLMRCTCFLRMQAPKDRFDVTLADSLCQDWATCQLNSFDTFQ